VQHGLVAIPKSQDPVRMRQNLAIFDFALDTQDLAALALLDGEHRQGGDPDTNLSCSPGRMSLCDFATGAGLTQRAWPRGPWSRALS
jgi:hypothetical protein